MTVSEPTTPLLDLSPDELLSTTRAVRKRLDLDRPVPLDAIRECVGLATQAPTGSNMQNWHFVVVTDANKRAQLGAIYQRAFAMYRDMPFAAGNLVTGDPERDATQQRVMTSAEYLAEVMGRVPVLVIACVEGRTEQFPPGEAITRLATASGMGSIIPAAWSFCLAARARGLGTSWTTLHLMFEEEAAAVVGIPFQQVTQAALIPVGYTQGTDFKPAPRIPVDNVLHVDNW